MVPAVAPTLVALLVATGSAAPARVVLEVRAPASTPADATLWLSGDRDSLGRWNGAGVRLVRAGDHVYRIALRGPAGAVAEYKLTRGGWDTVEKGPGGEELANRRLTYRDGDTIRVVVAAWRDEGSAAEPRRSSTMTGDIRRLAAFASRHVPARDVLVWLPPDWRADSLAPRPVVYLLDGQNVFDAATSFIGVEWGADEIAARGVRDGRLPSLILVAVPNSPERRSEYTRDPDPQQGGGGSARFARFLAEELCPEIVHRFHADARPERTAIIGSSLGGLCALDAVLDPGSPFGAAGSLSPSVWWAGRAIVQRAAATHGARPRIWLDMGTDEGTPREDGSRPWVADVERLRDTLVANGWQPGRDLHFEIVSGGRHDERAWSARLGRLLEWLLPPR